MAVSNRTLIEKAQMSIAQLTVDGGYLEAEQAKKFIQVAIKKSKILKECRTISMKAPKRKLETFLFGSRVLHVGTSGQALAEAKRSRPDLGMDELNTHLFKAEVRLPYEVLEDNIERDGLKSTIFQKLPEACGRDMGQFALMSVVGSADEDLAQFNGFMAQATTNTINVASAAISQDVWKNMLRDMSSEFKEDPEVLRFYCSTNTELLYRDLQAQKATESGQKFHDENRPMHYGGVKIVPLSMIAETGNLTQALLVHPKNMVVGIQRKIMIESAKEISEGVVVLVASVRFDAKYEYEPAVIRAYDINVA